MSKTKHEVSRTKEVVLVWFPIGNLWGIFTSEKKARKAIEKWKQTPDDRFTFSMYELDYRLKNAPAKYLSDTPLESSDGVHSVDRNSAVRK